MVIPPHATACNGMASGANGEDLRESALKSLGYEEETMSYVAREEPIAVTASDPLRHDTFVERCEPDCESCVTLTNPYLDPPTAAERGADSRHGNSKVAKAEPGVNPKDAFGVKKAADGAA